MNGSLSFDPASFKGMEYAGWQKGAASYGDLFGSVTRHAVEPLLNATDVGAEKRVLEVCCGIGYATEAARGRGAKAIGVDFAPAMIAAARRHYPSADFEQGDAEALGFADCAFDVVICAFGVNHLPQPEKALAESYRVLRPGGKYAFTMWCVPEKSKFHQLVMQSIRTHGTLDVQLPTAPPPFRFSDPEICIKALLEAGFTNPQVSEVSLAFRPTVVQQVLDLTYSAVRLEMILAQQAEPARELIHRAILEGAETFRVGGRIEIPMPAVLASGQRST